MKVFSLSNRFYYREFPDLKNIILHDLRVYNRVLHKAYKCLYDRAYKGASQCGVCDRKEGRRIPKEYHEYREWKEVIRDLGKATLEGCRRTPYLSLFR